MGEIVSSTGGEGLAKRSYNRWYYNRTDSPIQQASEVLAYFEEMNARWWRRSKRRDIMRGLTIKQVVEDLVSDPSSRDLVEVAFPISDDSWYLQAAQRYGRRNPLRPVSDMSQEVRNSQVIFEDPIQTVRGVLEEGYRFITQLPTEQSKGDLLELWGNTFGWNREQIKNFASRLKRNDPSVWFSAIQDREGHVVAAAMAESLRVQKGDGYSLDLIESTEWRSTKRNHMKAVLDHLHAQVIDSYQETGGNYMIFAECNMHSRSYRAAQKSGMVMPESGLGIPQILVQNVQVNDGRRPHGLRDFAFMYLPRENYSEDQARQVLHVARIVR